MELVLTDFHSGDIVNVWSWEPSSLAEVYFQLTVEVSEKGREGGHLFQLTVATLEGLVAMAARDGYRFPDRSLLLFAEYSWENVLARLNRIVRECTRETWNESMLCLQRYFIWEYEDYQSAGEGEER